MQENKESQQKHKEKIKKLLELSMSDNENEAAIALRQAMSLMNKHNITQDEVHGQQMVEKLIHSPYYRLPDWFLKLNTFMGEVSGCLMVYRNGNSYFATKSYIRFVGRERDVENAVYLVTFLQRSLDTHVKAYKAKLKNEGYTIRPVWIKSYRYGFIKNIYTRIVEAKNQFFTEAKPTDLVCIDNKARIREAEAFFEKKIGKKIAEGNTQATYIRSAIEDGSVDANQLQIMNAINGQDNTMALTYSRKAT